MAQFEFFIEHGADGKRRVATRREGAYTGMGVHAWEIAGDAFDVGIAALKHKNKHEARLALKWMNYCFKPGLAENASHSVADVLAVITMAYHIRHAIAREVGCEGETGASVLAYLRKLLTGHAGMWTAPHIMAFTCGSISSKDGLRAARFYEEMGATSTSTAGFAAIFREHSSLVKKLRTWPGAPQEMMEASGVMRHAYWGEMSMKAEYPLDEAA